MDMTAAEIVRNGEAFLGIELGSTRIKAVLSDAKGNVIAQGSDACGRAVQSIHSTCCCDGN